MFGDPVKNPFGWPTMTLDQATKEIVSGQCLNGDAGKLQPGQKAVLKVSAVTYGSFDANEYKVLRDTKQITKNVIKAQMEVGLWAIILYWKQNS